MMKDDDRVPLIAAVAFLIVSIAFLAWVVHDPPPPPLGGIEVERVDSSNQATFNVTEEIYWQFPASSGVIFKEAFATGYGRRDILLEDLEETRSILREASLDQLGEVVDRFERDGKEYRYTLMFP